MTEYRCPTCNASFETQRGRGVHHVRVHGERLPNRSCDFCVDRFYSDYAKKYCSHDCLLRSDSYAEENHPNYRGAKETTACRICGTEFGYYPSDKLGLYCADCVENADWRNPPKLTGSDHPRWSGGKIERTCQVCGESVKRHPSGFKYDVVVCGETCHRVWLSEAFTGEDHPNWKGGGNEAYGKGWAAARSQTLTRDDHTCVICGRTKEDLGRNPDVHHIVPVRRFVEAPAADKVDAHVTSNLVTLCVACHRRADFGHPTKVELKQLIDAGD